MYAPSMGSGEYRDGKGGEGSVIKGSAYSKGSKRCSENRLAGAIRVSGVAGVAGEV